MYKQELYIDYTLWLRYENALHNFAGPYITNKSTTTGIITFWHELKIAYNNLQHLFVIFKTRLSYKRLSVGQKNIYSLQ